MIVFLSGCYCPLAEATVPLTDRGLLFGDGMDGVVTTHPEGPCILGGITRTAVLESAHQEELPVAERPVLRGALARAEELFLSGTSAEVLPVTRVDGQPIAGGRPGPIAPRLRAAFQRLV